MNTKSPSAKFASPTRHNRLSKRAPRGIMMRVQLYITGEAGMEGQNKAQEMEPVMGKIRCLNVNLVDTIAMSSVRGCFLLKLWERKKTLTILSASNVC
jgi:hypothetical protein